MENARKWRTQPGEILGEGPVIPVIVIPKLEQAVPLARALTAGGIRVLEITLRTPAALAAISAIRREVPEAIVGAGTVTNAAELEAVAEGRGGLRHQPGADRGAARGGQPGPDPLDPRHRHGLGADDRARRGATTTSSSSRPGRPAA